LTPINPLRARRGIILRDRGGRARAGEPLDYPEHRPETA